MSNKKLIDICILFFLCSSAGHALSDEALGQMIQINTQLHSFVGRPSWLLMIRDLDHSENVPYLFDFRRGENFWIAPTLSKNYLITASTLTMSTYQSRYNTYKTYQIHNFCHLESFGHISRGESMFITISGDLSPNTDTYTCHISRYSDTTH